MKNKNIFWGIFLVLVSLALFADAFNFFIFTPNLFKIVLSIALVALSLSNMPRLNFFGIIMPLAVAVIINGKYFGVTGQTWLIIWASLILSLGLSQIFKRKRIHNYDKYSSYNESYNSKKDDNVFEAEFTYTDDDGNAHTNPRQESVGDYINIRATFTDRTRYVRSENFSGGTIENTFGALRVYFDGATFNPNGAILDVECSFGQMVLYIPKNVNVINNVDNTLASVKDDRRYSNSSENSVNLVINGDVTFGEIQIIYI